MIVRAAVFILLMSICFLPQARACVEDIISAIHDASVRTRASLDQHPEFDPMVVPASPLHITSFLGTGSLYIAKPDSGDQYGVIQLNPGPSFGFHPKQSPQVNWQSFTGGVASGLNLRSIDMMPVQQTPFALVTYQVGDNIAVVPAFAINTHSGEMGLVKDGKTGIEIEGVNVDRDHFVVSVRLGTNEAYSTDGSRRIRSLHMNLPENEINEQNLSEVSFSQDEDIEIPKSVQIQGEEYQVAGVDKLQFFNNQPFGYVRMRLAGGQIAFAPLRADESGQIRVVINHAKILPGGVNRSSVDPLKRLVYVSYPDRIDVLKLDSQEGQFEYAPQLVAADWLKAGETNLGVEFMLLREDSEAAFERVGVVLVGSKTNDSTRLIFFEVGGRSHL